MPLPFTYGQVMNNQTDFQTEFERRKGVLYRDNEVRNIMNSRIERAKEIIRREPDLSPFFIAQNSLLPITTVRTLIYEIRNNPEPVVKTE